MGQSLEMSDYLLFYDKIVRNWIIFAVIDHQMPPNASPNGSQLRVHKNLYFMEFLKLFLGSAIFSLDSHNSGHFVNSLILLSLTFFISSPPILRNTPTGSFIFDVVTSKGDPSCNYIFLLKYLWLDPEAGRGSENVFLTDTISNNCLFCLYIFSIGSHLS